jgi:flagellar biogenesis protein FliO
MSSMLSYVFFGVAIVLLVLWVMRRSSNKRSRGR